MTIRKVKFSSGKDHWARELFVNNAKLYMPILQSKIEESQRDVDGLCQIFNEFGIPPGSKVLDLCCGIGRHSINLSRRGYEVVGYDPSPFFLSKARRWAKKEALNKNRLRFYKGGLTSILKLLLHHTEIEFDVIINMFNSLGYTGVDEDIQVFKEIIGLASQNCVLIIESENRDWRLRNFEPAVTYDFNKSAIYETWKFDLETSVSKSRSKFYKKIGPRKDLRLLLDMEIKYRLYSLHELKDIITKAGWSYVKTYGNLQRLDPPTYDSKNIVTIGKRNSSAIG